MKKILFSILFSLPFLITSEISAQPAPTLIYPSGPNIQQPITFDWTDVQSPYRMQVWDMSQNIVVDTTNLPQSQCTVPLGILAPLTQYQWRAAVVGGNWSGFLSFTTAISAPPAPTLVYPPNDTTNMPTSFTFIWNAVPPPVSSYRLQVSTDPSFATTTIDVPGLTSSQYAVSGLPNGTLLYWRVNASNPGGTGNWSSVWHFTTVPAPPPPPALTYPPNNGVNIALTFNFSWQNVIGATSYRLQVATDVYFQNKIIDTSGLTATSYPVLSGVLSGSTQYFWHVASGNIGGYGSWSSTRNFTTVTGPPAAPVLVAPPNTATNISRTPLLDWNPVPTAINYTLNVDDDPNFTAPLVIDVTVTATQYQVTTPLNYNTTYYWRVRASNYGGPGPWSTVWHFTTVPALPPAPTLIAPPNTATNVSLTPYMDWTTVPEATGYRLQISANSNFTSLVLNTVIDSSNFSVQSGILQGGTQFWWRVASINAAGQGAFSTVWSFTTKQTQLSNIRILLEGFYNPASQLQTKDTVKIFLASSAAPFNFVDSTKAYLSAQGTDTASFEYAPNGNYYIVVKHRNHLETWSALPQSFVTGNYVNYDFTTSSSKAYGNNMKQAGGVWVFYGGDADQDGNVLIVNDYNLFRQFFGQDGYLSPDFNGDNYVDGYDLPILYSNFFKSVVRPQ